MLYQLSYEPQTAGAVGLEPTTFEVEARHSIQLSYTPMFFVSLCYHRTFRASYQSIAFSQLLEGLRR
jgi:hypothetical protein